MGQIIKSSGNDTRSEPTLDSCLAWWGPSYGNALNLGSCPSTLSSLVLGLHILGAKELVSSLIKNLRGLWKWNRHETHLRKKQFPIHGWNLALKHGKREAWRLLIWSSKLKIGLTLQVPLIP
jgi:hypothetical protein